MGTVHPERRKPASSLLITSLRKRRTPPPHPTPAHLQVIQPGTWQSPTFLQEHLGWRGPAFLRHSPTPARSGMCCFYLVLCFCPGLWNSKAEREVGNWVGPGLEENWEHYLFKGNASPPHPRHDLNWFLLICSGSLWIMADWLISRALGEDWGELGFGECVVAQPTRVNITGHRCSGKYCRLMLHPCSASRPRDHLWTGGETQEWLETRYAGFRSESPVLNCMVQVQRF